MFENQMFKDIEQGLQGSEIFKAIRIALGFEVLPEDFLMSILDGDVAEVKKSLKKNVDVNLTEKNGDNPVIWAVRHGRDEILKLLIENGADLSVNETRYCKRDLLDVAINREQLGIVKILSKNGLDLSAKQELLKSASLDASSSKMLDFMLDHTDYIDDINNGLLKKAILNNRPQVVKSLIERGADIDISMPAGTSIYQWIKRFGYTEIASVFIEYKKEKIAIIKEFFTKTVVTYNKLDGLLNHDIPSSSNNDNKCGDLAKICPIYDIFRQMPELPNEVVDKINSFLNYNAPEMPNNVTELIGDFI